MPFENGTKIKTNGSDPVYEVSRQKGFRASWPVASRYEIRDSILLPAGSAEWRSYYPATQKTIPIQLAKIKVGDEKALLAFAKKYGSLGFTETLPFAVPSVLAKQLLHSEDEILSMLMESCGLSDMKMWKAWIANGCAGDPLPWVWAHIQTLKFCIDLDPYIEAEDDEELSAFLRNYQGVDTRSTKQLGLVPNAAIQHESRFHTLTFPFRSKVSSGLTVSGFARFARRELINKNLSGIRIGLEPEGSREKSYFAFRSLIEMAYWHLHNQIAAGTIKHCERPGCDGFFVRTHGRERFCPEPTTGPKNESRCAVLDRASRAMPKYRKKLKQKQKRKN
ncbi:MAG: hypothetical protein U0412_07635 [Nitrospira sp.]